MAKGLLPRLVLVGIVAAVLVSTAGVATAQGTVKVVGVVLSVKHRAGPTGNFVATKVGDMLPPGSRVQTGARSKCALKFPNGGVIRMGERSDLIIQSPSETTMKLSGGQLWAKVVSGTTASVEGSYGVAVVKGTEWTFDGATIICYDGAVSYQTAAGMTDVPAGYEGTANPDGQVTRSPAPGREYPGGDLIQWFGGIRDDLSVQVTAGESAGVERREAQIAIDQVVHEAVTPQAGSLNVIIQGLDTTSAEARARLAALGDPATPDAGWGFFPGVDPNTLAPMSISHPTGVAVTLPGGRLGQAAETEKLPDKRYFFGPYTPADVFGYIARDGGTLGLRFHPHVVWGPVYIEAGATTRLSKWYGDGTDMTEAFATLRQDWGEVTLGRQRFLEGPVNNSRLGSLLTFDTGDALRVKTKLGELGVDAAYVRTMSPVIGTRARGWYGRLEYPVMDGIAGLNVVTNTKADDTGLSLDAAIPVIEGKLDLYGEYGRDPFGRNLYTVGAYFPGLYQKENIDLFVEYAARESLPSLTSLRLYKQFSEDLTGVLSIDQASGDSLNFGAGVIWRFGD